MESGEWGIWENADGKRKYSRWIRGNGNRGKSIGENRRLSMGES